MKNTIRSIQQKIGVTPDGIIGPRTLNALAAALGVSVVPRWPTQQQVRSGQSIFGAPGQEENLTALRPPYTLYYEGKPLRTIRVHRLIAAHVQQALQEILRHYGSEDIHRLGLELYGGCYNLRPTAGGSSLSMHAWGIALDFSPDANAYRTKRPRASLSSPECEAWWHIWENHGAVSLGRERDYDWMHLQFARLA